MQEKVKQLVERYGLSASKESRYIDLIAQAGDLGKALLGSSDYGLQELHTSEEIREEAGNLLFSLLALLNDFGIDENEVLDQVIARYEERMKEVLGEK